MNHSLKYLTLLLVGATLASAETKPTKESAKPVPANHPAVAPGSAPVSGVKPGPAKANLDGNFTEVKYGVNPIEPTDKVGQGDGFFQSQAFFLLLLVIMIGVMLCVAYFIWLRKKLQALAQVYGSRGQSPDGVSVDLQEMSKSIASLNVRLQNITVGQTGIASSITSLGNSLSQKVAEASVTALTNSDLGKAKKKIETLEGELFAAQASLRLAADERGRFSEDSLRWKGQAEQAAREKGEAEEKAATAQATITRQQSELDAKAQLIADAQAEAKNERNAAAQLRADANKGYEVMAPAKLKGTELGVQMQAIYEAALAGDVAAIAAWSTLTTFASAQADPAAKDFQLQIVRRLGVALVGHWKHQGLSDKERHERLSHWAKSLNEHADNRFNLLVPALGEPIDKTRMTCASTSTAIREVLCWQVRNPSGASFSLAEVA